MESDTIRNRRSNERDKMKIDVMEGDTWYTTGTAIFQYRGGEWRAIGEELDDWSEGEPNTDIETPTDLSHAKLNAESLGHELVMPEEKGPFYLRGGADEMRVFATKDGRDKFGADGINYWRVCTHTGEVIQ